MFEPTGWSKKRVLAHTLSSSDGYASTAAGSVAAARDLGSDSGRTSATANVS